MNVAGICSHSFSSHFFSFYIFWQRHHENRKGHDSFYEKVSKMKFFKFISSSRILILLCVIHKRLLFLGPTRWVAYSSHGPFMKKRILKKWVTLSIVSRLLFYFTSPVHQVGTFLCGTKDGVLWPPVSVLNTFISSFFRSFLQRRLLCRPLLGLFPNYL